MIKKFPKWVKAAKMWCVPEQLGEVKDRMGKLKSTQKTHFFSSLEEALTFYNS